MASGTVSPTLHVLQEIRDELRQHGAILREHGGILREHGDRLEAIERRQTETETRIATELTPVAGALHEVRDLLRDGLRERARVDDREARLRTLERKVG